MDWEASSGRTSKACGLGSGKRPVTSGSGAAFVQLEPTDRTAIRNHALIYSKSLSNIAGVTESDAQFEREQFIENLLHKKVAILQRRITALEAEKKVCMVEIARDILPGIQLPDYEPPASKKRKKQKKGKKKSARSQAEVLFVEPEIVTAVEEVVRPESQEELDIVGIPSRPQTQPTADQKPGEVNSDVIFQRIVDAPETLNKVTDDKRYRALQLELKRTQTKLEETQHRLELSCSSQRRLLAYSSWEHDESESINSPGNETRKNDLFKMLQLLRDQQLNIDSLESALQHINGHLVSTSELNYIYQILDLPGRKRINLKLFSALAALSERIIHLDPFMKKVIKDVDYEELLGNIQRAKELFELLADDTVPPGFVSATSLYVELLAGSLHRRHIEYLLEKLNRHKDGLIDILDFLILVPLFMEVHKNIVSNPLGASDLA